MILLLNSITLPVKDNVGVGIYCSGGTYAKELTDRLVAQNMLYDFRAYASAEALEQDVLAGKLECGFSVGEKLDEQLAQGKLKEVIVCITTPMSVKGAVIRETVYAELFRIYSDFILQKAQLEVFGTEDAQLRDQMQEYNHFYQDSADVFQLEIQEIDTAAAAGHKIANQEQTYPVRGMVGLFVFLIMFLAHSRKFDEGGSAVDKVLTKSEQFVFGSLNHAAAGTFAGAVGLALIVTLTDTGSVGKEIFGLLLLILISSVWIMLVGSLMKKNTTFVASILSMVVANLLICPIFINLETFLPAFAYVKLLFPLGIYLQL